MDHNKTATDPAQPLPSTESVHPLGRDLDRKSTSDALAHFSEADQEAVRAVAGARPELATAIDRIAERLIQGGRLIYVGAGTSGRLAALDAAELPPTFQSDPNQVLVLLAGGPKAMGEAIEGAEDDRDQGAEDLLALQPSPRDCVFGITASGGAPYVHGALNAARGAGAHTIFMACVPPSERPDDYDISIRLLTGPELVAGSTRLKAGTATKLALNSISTLVMARLGKLYGHLMVDVNTSGNSKLWARGVRMVREITGLEEIPSEILLRSAEGSVKTACVMHRFDCDRGHAEQRLLENAGHLRATLQRGV
ncbi:MAG: N-acetylmuramic acid 6-phosphate etherase [Planctomycetota bacterium]|nr:N-acetylmuramic acid 6-phosphate etherase [Planctomycetota bacterium]